jgi:hypothetical protein
LAFFSPRDPQKKKTMPHPWTPPPKPVEERPKVATPLSPLQLARQQLEREWLAATPEQRKEWLVNPRV